MLELYSKQPFGFYVGIDKLSLEEFRFKPLVFRECDPEETAIGNPCDIECHFDYWRRLTATQYPMAFSDFKRAFSLRPSSDLMISPLNRILGSEKRFDFVLVSDILHLLGREARTMLIRDIMGVQAQGCATLVRAFIDPGSPYGFLDEAELKAMDGLLGDFEELSSVGFPGRTTRLYGS